MNVKLLDLFPPLCHQFLSFPQSLLSVHDVVAQKSYDPELPPLPEGIEDDEDSVKIIRLVKNKEPLVSRLFFFASVISGKSILNLLRNKCVQLVEYIVLVKPLKTHSQKNVVHSFTPKVLICDIITTRQHIIQYPTCRPLFSFPSLLFLAILLVHLELSRCIGSCECITLLQNFPITSLLFKSAPYFPLTQASALISIRVWTTTQLQIEMCYVWKGSCHVLEGF